jgi:Lrp/AsnC family leucine-responsive transcriptional regulator
LICEIIRCELAHSLDEIDLKLVEELQRDADRSNVELARLIGLSPAATLNRVRRLKESGLIRRIAARLDPDVAGFALRVYVTVTFAHNDESTESRFASVVRKLPQVIAADYVAGETDALLVVVARDVAELQRVLLLLQSRGGAQRVITYLRLAEVKPESPLPLRSG